MRTAAVVEAGGGEVVGDAPDRRVEVLTDDEAVTVTWTRFGARREGADLHVHRHHTDLFYVLEGRFTARLGPEGREVVLTPGTLVRIPPMVVHGFRNAGDAELRYLNLHAPGRGFADYLRGMGDGRPVDDFDQWDPPADGGRPVELAVVGGARTAVDEPGLRVVAHADDDAVRVTEAWCDPGREVGVPALGSGAAFAYVLDGALDAEGGPEGAGTGAWARLPAEGTTLRAMGDRPLRVLVVQAPGPAPLSASPPPAR